ncbi:hypothetical protein NITGR_590018 [Nitrospina gracilis 3/211]|uniref:Cardiolipin synthase N-terminal domain-containing protein n=1 Tax=Nitrospina gracilis (strain 3/211) TaxID=1266370 RepID=M1YZI8_NITG3|nr:hypothetical protein NITGR_590018 [Nitrospina gracilis 3/211]
MTEIFWIASLIFTTYMCIDCINRKEHFVWIIVMIVLMPVGAIAYFLQLKTAFPHRPPTEPNSKARAGRPSSNPAHRARNWTRKRPCNSRS